MSDRISVPACEGGVAAYVETVVTDGVETVTVSVLASSGTSPHFVADALRKAANHFHTIKRG